MSTKIADKFFNDVDFVSIVSTVKGIMTSDGSMSVLLDFERVLDECDLYAFKNWILGELVEGPDIGRYNVRCIFMWPYKLMPDPKGLERLLSMGAKVDMEKSKIKVPIEVKDYDDFVQGTMFPKMVERKVWFVEITLPLELMDSIKEGSIDIAGQTIDLEEIEDAYNEDLDKQDAKQEEAPESPNLDAPLGGIGLPAGGPLPL